MSEGTRLVGHANVLATKLTAGRAIKISRIRLAIVRDGAKGGWELNSHWHSVRQIIVLIPIWYLIKSVSRWSSEGCRRISWDRDQAFHQVSSVIIIDIVVSFGKPVQRTVTNPPSAYNQLLRVQRVSEPALLVVAVFITVHLWYGTGREFTERDSRQKEKFSYWKKNRIFQTDVHG